MSRRMGYFSSVMGMCDPDRYPRETVGGRPVSSLNSWSSSNSSHMYRGQYHSSGSFGVTTPDSRPSYSYPYNALTQPRHHYQHPSRNYEPRMAGSSTRRGGFYPTDDVLRSAKSHNSELSGEYERFRPMPISMNGYLEVPAEFPQNSHELSLMDPREVEDLCSLYRIDGGGTRTENIIAFLKHIGAIHLARSFMERDNYGCDY